MLTRWGICFGLWRCWGPFKSPKTAAGILDFYPKLEIMKPPPATYDVIFRNHSHRKLAERRKLTFCDARQVEYDVMKHFASFCQHSVVLSPKKRWKTRICTKKWLDHPLLMTAYFVIEQNWMQGWHYGKGMIYLRPIFRLTKLAFLKARAVQKENAITAPKIWILKYTNG